MNKLEFMRRHPSTFQGMAVYSANGTRLGRLTALDYEGLRIAQEGEGSPEHLVPYEEVMDVQQDRAVLANTQAQPTSPPQEHRDRAPTQHPTQNPASQPQARQTTFVAQPSADVQIPLREEELSVRKHERTRNLRLRKVIRTELKTISVPVSYEEIVIERMPLQEPREAAPTESTFQPEEFVIPLKEEQVVVTKRPVVREEVRVSKRRFSEEQPLRETVRHEDLDIERNGYAASDDLGSDDVERKPPEGDQVERPHTRDSTHRARPREH